MTALDGEGVELYLYNFNFFLQYLCLKIVMFILLVLIKVIVLGDSMSDI